MLIARGVVSLLVGGAAIAINSSGCAQDYPSKPMRIVTSAPGNAGDIASRIIAQGLTASWGQQVTVDPRGNGVVPAEIVSKAPPDGYTLLLAGPVLWITPLIQKTSYDPLKDLLPVALVSRQPNMLVVHPSLPVRSVKDLIALAKARPGELNYTSAVVGSASHLAAELFKYMAGVKIQGIPYNNFTTQLADLLGGQVQFTFAVAAAVVPSVKSGRLRALAVTSADPSSLFPGMPTIASTGLPGYESQVTHAMLGPARMPATIARRLNQEVVRILGLHDVKEKFFNAGIEIIAGSSEQLAAAMKSEMARLEKVIESAGIRGE